MVLTIRPRASTWYAALAVAVCLAVAACTGNATPERPLAAQSSEGTPSSPSSPAPSTDGGGGDAPSPTSAAGPRVHPVSIPALFGRRYDGRGLRPGRVLFRTDAYTQRFVTYRSGSLRISGVLNVPNGTGRFPHWSWRTATSTPRST